MDIWNSGDLIRENIRHLAIFEGEPAYISGQAAYVEKFGYTFVLGGTNNGQILVIDKDGFISCRTQVWLTHS